MKQNAVFRLTKRRFCICKTAFYFRETPFFLLQSIFCYLCRLIFDREMAF